MNYLTYYFPTFVSKLKITGDISISNLALYIIVVIDCSFKRLVGLVFFFPNPLKSKQGPNLQQRNKIGQGKGVAFNHKGVRPSVLTS